MTVETAAFVLGSGKPKAVHKGDVTRQFCPHCGTPLTYEHAARKHQIDVCLALINQSELLAPTQHIWVSHKAPWLVIADGLPEFAEWAPS